MNVYFIMWLVIFDSMIISSGHCLSWEYPVFLHVSIYMIFQFVPERGKIHFKNENKIFNVLPELWVALGSNSSHVTLSHQSCGRWKASMPY